MENNTNITFKPFKATGAYMDYLFSATDVEHSFGKNAVSSISNFPSHKETITGSEMPGFTKVFRQKILLVYINEEKKTAKVIFEITDSILDFANFCPKIFVSNEKFENPSAYLITAIKEILYRINPNFRLEATTLEYTEKFTTDYDYFWKELPILQKAFFQLLTAALSYNAMITNADMDPVDVFDQNFTTEYYKYFNEGYKHTIEYISFAEEDSKEEIEESESKESADVDEQSEVIEESSDTSEVSKVEESKFNESTDADDESEIIEDDTSKTHMTTINEEDSFSKQLDAALDNFLFDMNNDSFTTNQFHSYCKEHIKNFTWSSRMLAACFIKPKVNDKVLIKCGKTSAGVYEYKANK